MAAFLLPISVSMVPISSSCVPAVSAYLGCYRGETRLHTESDLRVFCAGPRSPRRSIEELVVGAERVVLARALTALGQREGVEVVRVDSGGALIGALLNAGLLDEMSLLIHPRLAGVHGSRRWHGSAPPPARGLRVSPQVLPSMTSRSRAANASGSPA
jgi:hypothetical protein